MRSSQFSSRKVAPLRTFVLLGLITLFSTQAHGDMQAEIDHLLRYIETADCTFIRNGSSHDSRSAGEHIRKKYRHTKRHIRCAEDFIRYVASQSSISGQPYRVICNGVPMLTADWLTKELARIRENAP
jgi:hypothetical protein